MKILLFLMFFMQNVFSMNLCQVNEATRDRIITIKVTYWTFTNTIAQMALEVLDTCAESYTSAFEELYNLRFPLYAFSCYNARAIIGKHIPALHAFGAAVDVNYLMNPYYNVLTHSIIPERYADRALDSESIMKGLRDELRLPEEESSAVLSAVIQEEGSDDWFINRNFVRRGMITPECVKIFKKHGFDIWGGMWRQPIDYMHFQISRPLAESLLQSTKEQAAILWSDHLAACNI